MVRFIHQLPRRVGCSTGFRSSVLALSAALGVAANPVSTTFQGLPLDDPIPEVIREVPVGFRLEPVLTQLVSPNYGISAPGEPLSLYISEQTGLLYDVDLATGNRRLFLDTTARLVPIGIFGPGSFDERGLLGFAFHPDYLSNRLFYTYTSEPLSGPADFSTQPSGVLADHQSVVTEWQAVPGPSGLVIDPASARELLRIDQPQFNHNAGTVSFGPDGLLYISLGDGGGADDMDGQPFIGGPLVGHGPDGNGQDRSNPLGTVLRIDPLASNSANGSYGIPTSNPFVGQSGVEEIYAYGLRNPFRFSFDTLNGDLWLADVGQNDIEEINIVSAGDNLGWPLKEGSFFFDPNRDLDGFVTDVDPGVPANLVDPVMEYDHDEGIAIIGGFVYRGSAIPQLQGTYIFGDYASPSTGRARLFALRGSAPVELRTLDGLIDRINLTGFGQDAAGELYVMGNETGVPAGESGVVLRLAP